jgi:hypothetical protein
MAWTAPRTWASGELLTSTELNTQLRDNLLALKSPASTFVRYAPNPALQITSTTFVDIHTTLNMNLQTNGGPLLIVLNGRVYHSPGSYTDCFFDVNIDSVSQSSGNGILWVIGSNATQLPFSTVWLTESLTAGNHTIKIQLKRGGANTNPVQVFEVNALVREVS